MARYVQYNQKQNFLIALDIETNFPENSFVRFLNDFIENHIDIKPFAGKRNNDLIGAKAKNAIMMLKIIFYSFSIGIYSMRDLANNYLPKHLDFIYLSGMQRVHHSTLSRFINFYSEQITQIFSRILYVANNMGYITKNMIAIDGCKIKANASKKFTGTYESFKKKKKTYEKMINNLLEKSQVYNKSENDKRKIDRLKTDYENTIKKLDTFLSDCKNKNQKTQINLVDPDSIDVEFILH